MISVLFVCTGNICRSILAEALFRRHVQEAGLTVHFEIDSVATSTYEAGNPPDWRTATNAESHGLSLGAHTSRQITPEDIDAFNYIVCMTKVHLDYVQKLASKNQLVNPKISLFGAYVPKGFEGVDTETKTDLHFDLNPHPIDVPDPYFGSLDGFEHVYQILNMGTANITRHLRAESGL